MAEKCPCQTYVQSCCACVSMHCDKCHGHSEFVQGRFCSNCGRPLKAELTRLYVPKSEVEELKVRLEMTEKAYESLRELYHTDTDALVEARRKTEVEVAREIFEEIEEFILTCIENDEKVFNSGEDEYYDGRFMGFKIIEEHLAKLKKKYTERVCTDCTHFVGCECFSGTTCDQYETEEE